MIGKRVKLLSWRQSAAVISILALMAFAFTGEERLVLRFMDFIGQAGRANINVPLAVPYEMVDLDLERYSNGTVLSLRRGFRQLGLDNDFADYPITGLFWYTPFDQTPRLMAVNGRQLHIYNEGANEFKAIGTNALSGSCRIAKESDTLFGITTKWWPLSVYNYTQVSIDGNTYDLNQILGDTIIILETPYTQTTSDSCDCFLLGDSAETEGEIFSDNTTRVMGLMYGNKLVMVDSNMLVVYAGGVANEIYPDAVSDSVSGYSDWRYPWVVFHNTGGPSMGGKWYQIWDNSNPYYNMALKASNTNWRMIVDSLTAAYWFGSLPAGNEYKLKKIESVAWDTVLKSVVENVIVCSTKTAVWDYVTVEGRKAEYQAQVYRGYHVSDPPWNEPPGWRRRRDIYHYVYRYTWYIRETSTGWPEAQPQDTLRYMTTVARNIIDNYNNNNALDAGDYGSFNIEEVPVLFDTLPTMFWDGGAHYWDATDCTGDCDSVTTGDNCIIVTTMGYSGAWYKDTTAWNLLMGSAYPACDTPVAIWDIETAVDTGLYCDYTPLTACFCQFPRDRVIKYLEGAEIIDVADYAGQQADGAHMAFLKHDSLVLVRMARQTTPSFASPIDTTQNYNRCIIYRALERLWLAGDTANPNTLYYTEPNNMDSVSGWEYISQDDGSYITAISGQGTYVYVHKPGGVWVAVCRTESNNDVDNPEYAGEVYNVYKSPALEGAVNRHALVNTPRGDFYVGATGAYVFNNGNAQKISDAVDFYFADSINHNCDHSICVGYHGDRVYISYVSTGSDVNDRMLIYDVQFNAWWKYSLGANIFLGSGGPPSRDSLYFGSPQEAADGRVLLYGGVLRDTGAFITPVWKSGWWCGNGPWIDKDVYRYGITALTNAGANIIISAAKDFAASWDDVDTLNLSSAGWKQIDSTTAMGLGGQWLMFEIKTDSADSFILREFNVGCYEKGTK